VLAVALGVAVVIATSWRDAATAVLFVLETLVGRTDLEMSPTAAWRKVGRLAALP
jgi:hypothetical protein